MNHMGTIARIFQTTTINSKTASRFSLMCSIATVALVVGLLAGVTTVQAAPTYYWTTTAANGNWSNGGNWGTTNGNVGDYPGNMADGATYNASAYFTNAATYNVVVDVFTSNLTNLFFSNFAGTTATITLDLDNNGLAFAAPLATGNSVVVGDSANSTTTVYIAGTPGNQADGLAVGLGQIVVGRNGNGTLILTNGEVSTGNATVLGNGSGGQGTVIVTGPNSYWSEKQVTLGGSSNSFGNTFIVSNNASMSFSSTPRIGSSSGEGGSSNNVYIIDHSYVNAQSGPPVLGNRAGTLTLSAWGGTVANSYTDGYANGSVSINNRLIIKNGGVWDNGSGSSAHSFCIGDANPAVSGIPASAGGGGPASNNVLTIMANSYFTNASNCGLTSGNTLDLQGGTFGATLTNNGIVQGWGTMLRNFFNSNGVFAVSNAVGALDFHQNVTLGTNSAITVQLGANPGATFPMGVTSNLTIRPSTLNVTAVGAFSAGTYTLFTWDSVNPSNKFVYQGWNIGSTPSPSFTYAVSTNTLGHVDLVVTSLAPPDSYSGWAALYFPGGGPSALGTHVNANGVSNTNLFLAGFNPTNNAAYPHITAIAKSGAAMNVTYLAANGDNSYTGGPASRTNVLEFTTGVPGTGVYSNNFQSTFQTNVLSGGNGNGVLTVISDPNGAVGATRYYRIRVIAP